MEPNQFEAIYSVLDNAIFGRIGAQEARDQIRVLLIQFASEIRDGIEKERMSTDISSNLGDPNPGYLGGDFSMDLQTAIAPLGNKVNQS